MFDLKIVLTVLIIVFLILAVVFYLNMRSFMKQNQAKLADSEKEAKEKQAELDEVRNGLKKRILPMSICCILAVILAVILIVKF